MKRKILFNGVWLSLILVCMNSCQNELDESLIAENGVSKSSFQTKSSNVVSALEQLENIPVNIKLVNANTDMIYLSARPKDKTIVLHNCDDGSLRQRWYISKGVNTGIPTIGTSSVINIKVVGGAKTNGYICPTGSVSAPGLILIDNVFGAAPFFYSPTSDGTSYAFSVYFRPDQMGVLGVMEYLYAKTIGGKEVAFGPENVAMGKNQWEIVPVENFRLIDVKYVEEENDKVLSSIDFIRTYDFNNSICLFSDFCRIADYSHVFADGLLH